MTTHSTSDLPIRLVQEILINWFNTSEEYHLLATEPKITTLLEIKRAPEKLHVEDLDSYYKTHLVKKRAQLSQEPPSKYYLLDENLQQLSQLLHLDEKERLILRYLILAEAFAPLGLLTQPMSTMPPMIAILTKAEARDLVAYLASLKSN